MTNIGRRTNPHNLVVFFQIAIMLVLIFFLLLFYSDQKLMYNWESVISTLGIALVVEQLIGLILIGERIADYKFVVVLLNGIFMLGQLIVHTFDLNVSYVYRDCRTFFNDELLWQSGLYVLCCMQAFYIGMIIRKRVDVITGDEMYESLNGGLNLGKVASTGKILLFITALCRLYTDVKYIIAAQTTKSYLATYTVAQTGIIDDISWLIIPAVFMVIVGLQLPKKKGRTLCILLISYFLVTSILTGIRRLQMSAVIAIALFYLNYYRIKIKPLKAVAFGLLAIVVLNILLVIREIRSTSNLVGLFMFFRNTSLKNNGLIKPIAETLNEFGLSFFSNTCIMGYVPKHQFYQLGTYFIYCMLAILPIGPVLRLIPLGSVSSAANTYYTLGVGATLFGDLYANFGYFGILATGLFSYFCTKWLEGGKQRYGGYYYIKYYSLMFAFINLARGSIQEMARLSVWLCFIPLFLIKHVKLSNIRTN